MPKENYKTRKKSRLSFGNSNVDPKIVLTAL